MPGVSITTSIVSLFTYVQNLGATVNLPKFELPESFVKVINIFTKFLFLVLNYLPRLPAFDIRSQLALLSLGIPLLLDIVFIWFVNPLMDTIVHLVDIIVITLVTDMIVEAIIIGMSKGKTYVIALGGIYLVFRLLLITLTKCLERRREKAYMEEAERFDEEINEEQQEENGEKKTSLNEYVIRICDLFMTTIVPGVQSKYDVQDLQSEIKRHSKTVRYEAKKKINVPTVVIMAVLTAAALVVGLWSHLVKNSKYQLPDYLRSFLPYICYVVAFILFCFILLNVTQCGRVIIVKFRQFANRWGLRLLMLFLDLLYIPVITNLVTVLTPEHFSCGVGYYLQYTRHKTASENSPFFPFINHTWDCIPCYPALVSTRNECQVACSGKQEWRVMGALNLRFFDDILIVSGGIIIFNVVAFLIGIPVLWRIIIRRNRSAIKRANVYGINFQQKWTAILDQLQTTGIFLFFTYRINCFNWSLILIFVKLLVMIITTIAGRINSNVYWALPALYFIILIATCCANPSIFPLNHILNLLLYFLNFGFSIIPLLPIFGYTLPQNVVFYVSLAIVIIPLLTTVVMLLCKEYPHNKDDPTYLSKKQIKKIKKKKKKIFERHFRKMPEAYSIPDVKGVFKMYDLNDEEQEALTRSLNHHHNDDSISIDDKYDFDIYEDREANENLVRDINDPLLYMFDFPDKKKLFVWDVKQDASIPNLQDKEVCTIGEGAFDSIEHLYHVYHWDTNPKNGEYYQKTKEFKVSKRVIYNRAKRMYEMIDIILDGATIELLTKTLNGMMLFGGFAFGWYLGALFAQESKSSNIFCG